MSQHFDYMSVNARGLPIHQTESRPLKDYLFPFGRPPPTIPPVNHLSFNPDPYTSPSSSLDSLRYHDYSHPSFSEEDDLSARLDHMSRRIELLESENFQNFDKIEVRCLMCESSQHCTNDCPIIPIAKKILNRQSSHFQPHHIEDRFNSYQSQGEDFYLSGDDPNSYSYYPNSYPYDYSNPSWSDDSVFQYFEPFPLQPHSVQSEQGFEANVYPPQYEEFLEDTLQKLREQGKALTDICDQLTLVAQTQYENESSEFPSQADQSQDEALLETTNQEFMGGLMSYNAQVTESLDGIKNQLTFLTQTSSENESREFPTQFCSISVDQCLREEHSFSEFTGLEPAQSTPISRSNELIENSYDPRMEPLVMEEKLDEGDMKYEKKVKEEHSSSEFIGLESIQPIPIPKSDKTCEKSENSRMEPPVTEERLDQSEVGFEEEAQEEGKDKTQELKCKDIKGLSKPKPKFLIFRWVATSRDPFIPDMVEVCEEEEIDISQLDETKQTPPKVKFSIDVYTLIRKIKSHHIENNFASGLPFIQNALTHSVAIYLILNWKRRKK